MKIFGSVMIIVALAVVLSCGYVAAAIFTSTTYDELSMNTSYNWAHFQKKAAEISKGMIANPAKPVLVKLTNQEVEGFLKLAIRDNRINSMIKGAKIILKKDIILAQINMSVAGLEKGVQLSGQPSVTADGKLQFTAEEFKIGTYSIPVTPSILALKAALPTGIVKRQGNTIILDIEDIPFHVRSLNVEVDYLTAELVVSPGGLLQMGAAEEALVQAVVKKAESLTKGLESKAATSLITSIQQKQEITPGDVEQAKSIYESLSPEDREALQKNMSSLLQDPAVQEILKKYGIKP